MVLPLTPVITYTGSVFIMSVAYVPVTKILLQRMLVSNCQQIQAGVVLRDMIKMLSYTLILHVLC